MCTKRKRMAARCGTRLFFSSHARGSSLVVSMLMLVVILLLGAAAARMALQGEKASRSDRDRQIAFQAAEAALMDAEMDIQNSTSASSRSAIFNEVPDLSLFKDGCGVVADGNSFGLCKPGDSLNKPVWLTVDFDATGNGARTVPFGTFTGQTMQTGSGMLPSKLPRYIIEVVENNKVGYQASMDNQQQMQGAIGRIYFYRVTAVGFGVQATTQAALQTYYFKVLK